MSKLQVMIKTIIFSLFLFLAFAPLVSAATNNVVVSDNEANSQTHVSVKSNTGSNTTCINGKCTTTEGENNTKVCVKNGECYESKSGNLDVKVVNGVTTVKEDDKSITPSPSTSPGTTITPKEDNDASISSEQAEVKEVMGAMTERKTDWLMLVGTHAFNIVKKLFLFSFF